MAVDIAAEMTTRYSSKFMIQLTNFLPGASTVGANLASAIDDATAAFERVTGREFEYTGINARYLKWQTAQVIQLTIWQLEAYKRRQTLEADARYQKWTKSVLLDREMNEVLQPLTNSTVTALDPNPPDGNNYPNMNESGMDKYVPTNADRGKSSDPRNRSDQA